MSRARSAARLAAVQALYQQDMEGTPKEVLLYEFHHHRLGSIIEDNQFAEAEVPFFDDIVQGVLARSDELNNLIQSNLSDGWALERLDRTLRQILRAGCYELVACPDIPVGSVIGEYLDVAHAFFGVKEKKFVNGLLDSVACAVRH